MHPILLLPRNEPVVSRDQALSRPGRHVPDISAQLIGRALPYGVDVRRRICLLSYSGYSPPHISQDVTSLL